MGKNIIIDSDLLYKPIKVNTTNVVFWSCCHLMHNPIHWETPLWKQRGFESADEHYRILIDRWNQVANSDTIGFLLGDNAFTNRAFDHLERFFYSINFNTIYMLGGNHIAGLSRVIDDMGGSNIWEFSENKRVILVPNYLEAFVCGQPIVVSHYALASWNGQSKGSYMLHGHSHGNLYNTEIGNILYKTRIMDVSVEKCPFPISFEEVRRLFQNVPAKAFDHHNNETQNPF